MKTKKVFYIAGCYAVAVALHVAGGQIAAIAPSLKDASSQKQLTAVGMTIHKTEQQLASVIQQGHKDYAFKHKLARQMQEQNRPEILIPQFMKHFHRGALASLSSPGAAYRLAKSASGGISGKVTVAGGLPDSNYPIAVVVFDSLGYYASHSDVHSATASYSIVGLQPGLYYVMTSSNHYVDEIYDNISTPLGNRETWRMAVRVPVRDGETNSGIDFDLQHGARISGRIFHAGGVIPLQEQEVTVIFTQKDIALPIYEKTFYIFSGSYNLTVPFTGECKMGVKVADYATTWFGNTSDWNTAATIEIDDFQSVINNIDITLIPDPDAALSGSIGGAISYSDQAGAPFFSAFYAFKITATDTVFTDLTIGLLGTYTFESLRQGDYIIYGNDILGNLLGGFNYLGQYYQNATTPSQARPVTVIPGQLVEGINFILQRGGSISGRVTNVRGVAIDSILVMAFAADLAIAEDLSPANLAVYLCGTDADGRYELTGLPTASYVVRTISDSLLNVNTLGFSLQFKKHGGKYVDEYYRDAQNIFEFGKAIRVPVAVPENTQGIDFVLDDGNYFSGTVKDAVSGAPVTNIMLFALNDTSAYPCFSFNMILKKQVKENGDFRLGPLPFGKYKLIAVAGGLEFKSEYLSEFYDGVRDFAAAPVLTLDRPDRGGIHFTLDRGAVIQGFISMPQNGGAVRAGADTLDGFPVLVYRADTGQLASLDFVQFNGGYRVDHLLPGVYKVLALPTLAPYAATYFGGGDTFLDPAGQTVTLAGYGELQECNITLETAAGCIAGTVHSGDPSASALSQVMVIAYDGSGHPCGLSLTDMDLNSGRIDANAEGAYVIEGLRSGQYFLRTFSLSSALGLSQQVLGLVDMFTGDLDVLGLLGNLSDVTSLFALELSVYQDQWYQGVAAVMDLDVMSLVFHLTAYGVPNRYDQALLPVYLPLPMAENIPADAVAVPVTDGHCAGDRNFVLQSGDLGDLFTGVEDEKGSLPEMFMVSPNHPNPFNPATMITFHLPVDADVSVVVYNIAGQRINTLLQQPLPAGTHQLRWLGINDAGQSLPGGVYLTQVVANGMRKTIKMTLVK